MGATSSKEQLGWSGSIEAMEKITSAGAVGEGPGVQQSPGLKCAVPVPFRWNHGAHREVYIVGSFSNWQTKIRLTWWSIFWFPHF